MVETVTTDFSLEKQFNEMLSAASKLLEHRRDFQELMALRLPLNLLLEVLQHFIAFLTDVPSANVTWNDILKVVLQIQVMSELLSKIDLENLSQNQMEALQMAASMESIMRVSLAGEVVRKFMFEVYTYLELKKRTQGQ